MQTDLQQAERRNAILRLLRASAVRKQEEIVDLLKGQGFPVTQSSVSRDLRDLGVLKAGGRYLAPDATQRSLDDFGTLRQFVRGVATAGSSLTVLRTTVGAAQSVAIALDKARWPEVIGTIAGDDTIFIAAADQESAATLARTLQRLSRAAS